MPNLEIDIPVNNPEEENPRIKKGNCDIHGEVYFEYIKDEPYKDYVCAYCFADQNRNSFYDKFPGSGLRSRG